MEKTRDELLTETRGLICKTVNLFCRARGIEAEMPDFLSEGYLAFLYAVDTFQSRGTKFSTWCCRLVWQRCLRKYKQRRRIHISFLDPAVCEELFPYEDDPTAIFEVGEEGRALIKILAEVPPELHKVLFQPNGKLKSWGRHILQKELRGYLQQVGWQKGTIDRAFMQVLLLVERPRN